MIAVRDPFYELCQTFMKFYEIYFFMIERQHLELFLDIFFDVFFIENLTFCWITFVDTLKITTS